MPDLFWENVRLKKKEEKIPIWEFPSTFPAVLVSVVGRHNKVVKRENLGPMCNTQTKKIDLEDPTPYLNARMKKKTQIVKPLIDHSLELRYGHAEMCVERYCELSCKDVWEGGGRLVG